MSSKGDKPSTKSDVKAEASANAKTEDKAVEPAAKAEAKVEGDKAAPVTTEAPKVEAAKPDTSTPAAPKAAEKAAEPAKATADAPASKDPARLPSLEKHAKSDLKSQGQIAVFISRKDSKLYVRQAFKPVFDVPVTIAPSDRLLGTHVFTAETDKGDPNLLRWSVVSLPVTARNAQKGEDEDRPSRRRKGAVAAPVETKPAPIPNGPAEALDRITVAPEVMARIAEALTSGGSIVISDQGIAQGETGEYTDFIVRLR